MCVLRRTAEAAEEGTSEADGDDLALPHGVTREAEGGGDRVEWRVHHTEVVAEEHAADARDAHLPHGRRRVRSDGGCALGG